METKQKLGLELEKWLNSLRALVTLSEDMGLIPRNNTAVHKLPVTPVPENPKPSNAFFWPL